MIVNSWTRREYYRIKAALHGKVPTRMELFRMMKEPQYLSCIEKSKENIFRQYLAALEEMGELSAEDEKLKMSRLQKNRTSEKKSCQTVDKVILRQRKGLGNKSVSQMESAVGIHFRRGKQRVSRLLS
jgi:hypothetical protein